MNRLVLIFISIFLFSSLGYGCGLDWTLPQAHFAGVEEHGYVAYWEKIGEVDLGEGMLIPVHINFNSNRESSSLIFGKGWFCALLESHVEPVNENCLKVIMPDGWTFTFLRNGNTQAWRGNSGWVGETNNTLFTIAAPCGWKIKFDQGKIREMVSHRGNVFVYKYNGNNVAELDVDNKTVVKFQKSNSSTCEMSIGLQKCLITWGQRPKVLLNFNQKLIGGFDPTVSQIDFLGVHQVFNFDVDKNLNPSLEILNDSNSRKFVWDAKSRQILIDGDWTYNVSQSEVDKGAIGLKRINSKGFSESYLDDPSQGVSIIQEITGKVTKTTRFTAGLMRGKVRTIETGTSLGELKNTYKADYNEKGSVIREVKNGATIFYNEDHNVVKIIEKGEQSWTAHYASDGAVLDADFNN